MPYIKQADRETFLGLIESIKLRLNHTKITEGELNYLITILSNEFLNNQGGESYANYNKLIGVLECCKLEIYRKQVAIYEENKENINGPVWQQ